MEGRLWKLAISFYDFFNLILIMNDVIDIHLFLSKVA